MEGTRLAHEDDLPACHALLDGALAAARAMRGGTILAGTLTADDLLQRWARTGPGAGAAAGPAAVLYVGQFHEAVVGLGAATTLARAGTGALSGRIECCYVEEEARGVGVGTALMEVTVAWCAQRGCGDIDALALPGDRSSKQRLEAAGFTARLLTLNRRLD